MTSQYKSLMLLKNKLVSIVEKTEKENAKEILTCIVQVPKEVEYVKCEDRNLMIVLNSEKFADYNSGCCQEVRWSIYFLYKHATSDLM